MSIVPVKINSVQSKITYGDVNYNNSYITDLKEDIEDVKDAIDAGSLNFTIPEPLQCNSLIANVITYGNPPNGINTVNGQITLSANPNAVDYALSSSVLYTTNVDDILYPNVGVDIPVGSYILDVEYRVSGNTSSATCKVLFYQYLINQWVTYNGTSRRTSSIVNNSGIGSNDSGYGNFQWILPRSFFSGNRSSAYLKIAMEFTVSTGSTTFNSQFTKYTLVRLT